MKSSPSWSVGELAAQFGLPTHVLRHWEAAGLLLPDRDPAGRRRYGTGHRSRVAVIIRGKQAGASLELLAELLNAEPEQRRELLARHHADLEARVAAIRDSQRLTEHARDCEHGDFTTCPHFESLVEQTIASLRPDDQAGGASTTTPA